MAWSGSAIFTQTMNNPLLQATAGSGTSLPTGWVTTGIANNGFKGALYLTTTPLNTDTMAHIGYNGAGGPWVTANEASGSNYTAGGNALGTLSYGIDGTATNALAFHAANLSWANVTVSAVFGDLVYCTSITAGTVANQGFCYNYFGGSQSVTAGTFTIQWFTTGYSSGTVFSITT
jgi:hypothetical protein